MEESIKRVAQVGEGQGGEKMVAPQEVQRMRRSVR